ncbi:MAG: hypothetical protein JWM98_350 [Thermoleophilia bacterium]|nr:hypothetical protein [Thermoleophilia bacterium]
MYMLSPIPPTATRRIAELPTYPPLQPFGSTLASIETGIGEFSTASMALSGRVQSLLPMAPLAPDTIAARLHAERGIAAVDVALATADLAPTAAVSALNAARRDAADGYALLTAKTFVAVDPTSLAPKFDSAANWLVVARNLLQL